MGFMIAMLAAMTTGNMAGATQNLVHDNPAAVYAMGDFDVNGAAVAPAAGPAEAKTLVLHVNGMVCDFCAQAIKKALEQRGGVEKAEIDLAAQTVTLTMADGAAPMSDADLKTLMDEAGYKLVGVDRK